jgi:hypothetical protein
MNGHPAGHDRCGAEGFVERRTRMNRRIDRVEDTIRTRW